MQVSNPFSTLAHPSRLYGLKVESVEQLRENPRRVVPDIMRLFLSTRVPITLWGPVGARKTRTIEALREEVDENGVPFQVITIMPSTMDPTVVNGMFYTTVDENGKTIMMRSIPEVAERIVEYHERTGGYTVLFMDEMTTCSPASQHALLGLMTHGKYGDLDISELITIVMAANPEGTVSTVNPLGEQVINRGGHVAWYGDPRLFIEEWSQGFGHPELVPEEDTEWYIRTLLQQDMNKAFRSDRWTVDELIPWDLFEHSERCTTDLGKMITVVNRIFADAPIDIRHHYLIECARALQGKEWASKMATTCAMERDRVDGRSIIREVKEAQVDSSWELDRVQLKFGSQLFESESRLRTHSSARLGTDQITSIAEDLLTKSRNGDRAAYLSLWVLAATAPNENVYAALHPFVLQMFLYGAEQARLGQMDQTDVRPQFVPETVRNSIKTSLQNR